MGDYRNRTTGEIKSQGEWRSNFPNMSLPRVWKQATLDSLDLDPVIEGPKPTLGAYQIASYSGVVQDSDGNWVKTYIAQDRFSDDAELGTKAEQEAAYQAAQDARVAEKNRSERDNLLKDSDWTQMNDSPLTNELKTQWAVYRSELRGITDLDAWPNLADEDWPVAP